MYNDEGEAKINNRGGLNNCQKEFPTKIVIIYNNMLCFCAETMMEIITT